MIKSNTDFQLLTLTPDEEKEALTYSPIQRAYLQNLLGEMAHAKINLKIDPHEFHSYLQQEAYLTAKIDLLRSLLSPFSETSGETL